MSKVTCKVFLRLCWRWCISISVSNTPDEAALCSSAGVKRCFVLCCSWVSPLPPGHTCCSNGPWQRTGSTESVCPSVWRNARLHGSIYTETTPRGVIKPDIYDFCGLISRRFFEVNMGCSSSTDTVVQPLTPEEVNGDEVGSVSHNPPLLVCSWLT